MESPLFSESFENDVFGLDVLLDRIKTEEEDNDDFLRNNIKKEVEEYVQEEQEYIEKEDIKEEDIKKEEDRKIKIEFENKDIKIEYVEEDPFAEFKEEVKKEDDVDEDEKLKMKIKELWSEDVSETRYPPSPTIKTEQHEELIFVPPLSALLEGLIDISDEEINGVEKEMNEEQPKIKEEIKSEKRKYRKRKPKLTTEEGGVNTNELEEGELAQKVVRRKGIDGTRGPLKGATYSKRR